MHCQDVRIRELARLQIRMGVNVQKGQRLHIRSMPVCAAAYARALVEEAYAAGAADVTVTYRDAQLQRLRYLHASEEALGDWYGWPAEMEAALAARGDCELEIFGSDPKAFEGCDPQRIRAARVQAGGRSPLDEAHTLKRIRRCTTAVPTLAWARCVFPDLDEESALDRLWDAVFKAARVTGDGQAEARWRAFASDAKGRCGHLTKARLRAVRYQSRLGTDVTIGLPKGHVWSCGASDARDGVPYYTNLPTEEIYTSPRRDQAEGVIAASMPLYWMGNVIDGIRLTMREGQVTAAEAATGQELLLELLAVDEGARHLGECALVGWDSPIRDLGVSFCNMLFDENAACHVALGMGFPLSVPGREAGAAGINSSDLHMDLMIGTADMDVTGIADGGEELPILRNGVFVL